MARTAVAGCRRCGPRIDAALESAGTAPIAVTWLDLPGECTAPIIAELAAVERVIEATVLLSGVGFESGGLSLAHALVRGFSAHPKIGGFLHGEAVAFGTVVQLAAEGRPDAEMARHAAQTRELGLPVSFKCFGVDPISAAELDEIARITCTAPYITHLTPAIDAGGVRRALERADRVGRFQ